LPLINLPPELEWIDAHYHLWDLSRIEYPWLLAKGEARFFGQPDPIRKNYLVSDYHNDTAGQVSRSVHIQVGAGEGFELKETEFINECSLLTGGSFPTAAVVAIDLGKQDVEAQLEAHRAFPVARGVRHMIGKSAEENPFLPPFEPEIWVKNWRLVHEYDLSFDLQFTEDQYEKVLVALEQVQELSVAICHLASPWDRSPEGLERWKTWMKRFAALPNTVMKISGLVMFSKQWDETDFFRWGEAALEVFGAERCMLGSNFPVDSLCVDYDTLFAAWQALVSRCSPLEAVHLAGRTAEEFYHL
jgi:predicted TIM-barrel fold metal-dependent hydrolase